MSLPKGVALLATLLFAVVGLVSALGTSCSAPLGAGTAGANDPYWLESIAHR
jgi:glucan 1,3-beta-glucosidase